MLFYAFNQYIAPPLYAEHYACQQIKMEKLETSFEDIDALYVMLNFVCKLGQAIVPNYLVKCQSKCCCEGIF